MTPPTATLMPAAEAVLAELGREQPTARRLEGLYGDAHDALLLLAYRLREAPADARWADGVEALATCLDVMAARHLRARVQPVAVEERAR